MLTPCINRTQLLQDARPLTDPASSLPPEPHRMFDVLHQLHQLFSRTCTGKLSQLSITPDQVSPVVTEHYGFFVLWEDYRRFPSRYNLAPVGKGCAVQGALTKQSLLCSLWLLPSTWPIISPTLPYYILATMNCSRPTQLLGGNCLLARLPPSRPALRSYCCTC